MNVIINNEDEKFNGINSIVFYSSNDPVKILHKYSSDKITNSDFIEYGVTTLLEKSKFNSNDLINYLDDNCREIFGYDPDDLSKVVDNYILPTNSSSNTPLPSNVGFFGSKTIQKNVLIVFEAPENVDYITLREEIGLNSETCGTKDNYKIRLKLNEEETNSNKVIFITLTLETYDTPKLLVTYNIWRYDINANRNKSKYTLRNDEFFSTVSGVDLIKEKENRILIDKSSGSIVGYDNIASDTPILNKKIAKWKDNKIFNPKVVYKIGDIVEYGKYKDGEEIKPYKYISLNNNNLGNTPPFSNKWILENKFSEFLTTKVNINVFPENSAETQPSGFFSLSKNANSCVFKIKYNPGYKLDTTIPNYISSGSTSLTDYASGYEGNGFYEIRLNGDTMWRTSLLNNRSITFTLKSIDYSLYFVDSFDTTNPSSITRAVYYSNDGGNSWSSNLLPIGNTNEYRNPANVPFNSETLIKVEYEVSNHCNITQPVIASGTTGDGNEESREIEIQTDGTKYYFIDKLSYVGSTKYNVYITREVKSIRITGDLKYLEINKIFREEKYGEPIDIRFYKDTNYKSEFYVHPKVYINGKMIQWVGNGQVPSYITNPLNWNVGKFDMTTEEIQIDGRTEILYNITGTCEENYDIQIKVKNDN